MAENQNQSNANVPSPAPNHFESPFVFDINNIPEIQTPFARRPITEDNGVFNSILGRGLINSEYRLPPIKDFNPQMIIDGGGNIGCSAIYYAKMYPDAQIYSLEPDKENFQLLKFNTVFYSNIHPIQSGLWNAETFIRVEDKGWGKWGFMTFDTTADDPAGFKATTISKVLADSGFEEIDILKLDIEGAEKEVFSAPDVDEWLPKVKVLTIELHDRMKRGCSYAFFKAISKYHWFHAFRGENLILIRESLMP
ncbi:MAG: FkbM family methyltransferase [Selenomonadaceae bacterium]|nr:FkbM family methyltransferase [Selenomonadaceae bacterium]MBQ6758965.1 FkbM family methyltransferase [Selenomonadaceae bacterium]MBR0102412.1 FkbM family methyltransferase [Selenomonadaceae bacterium]